MVSVKISATDRKFKFSCFNFNQLYTWVIKKLKVKIRVTPQHAIGEREGK
jgi:hypothetical protein